MKEMLKVRDLPIERLSPYAPNARKHTRQQISQIAKSIQTFGFINPVLIDNKCVLIAGHGRVLAAQELGLSTIPTIQVEHLSEAEKRAYILADNKIAENAAWDEDLLRIELSYLTEVEIDLDVEVTGFSTSEIDILLNTDVNPDTEEPPPPPPADPITREGDLWQLGLHRLLCGDCRDGSVIDQLMANKRARMVITDPPYNVPIDGHTGGLGKIKHNNFAMACGEMSAKEFNLFLSNSLKQLARVSLDGALHFVFMDWRHITELLDAAKPIYQEQINLCVWNKTNGGMGSFYRSQHELIFVFKKGKAPHINNVQLGQNGRYRTNIWIYPGVNSFGSERDEVLTLHPTVKPVQLIADAILDASKRGDIVLDGFLGSGSTILAAEQTGRIGYGIEIDPCYVDVTLNRWITLTGETPTLIADGRSFETVAADRHSTDSCEV